MIDIEKFIYKFVLILLKVKVSIIISMEKLNETEEQLVAEYAGLFGNENRIIGKIASLEDAELILNEEKEDILEARDNLIEYEDLLHQHEEFVQEYTENPNNELFDKIGNLERILLAMVKNQTNNTKTVPISQKKLISVKEFENLYSIGEEAQRKLRKRMKDPLPYVQLMERGNVLYECKEVEKWFENYKY